MQREILEIFAEELEAEETNEMEEMNERDLGYMQMSQF